MCLKFSQEKEYRIKIQGRALEAIVFVGVPLTDSCKDKKGIALVIKIKGTQNMN